MTREPAKFVRFVKELLGQEIVVVAPLLLAVFAGLCFIAIADEVTERDTKAIDEWVLTSLRQGSDLARPIGPALVTEAARGISALGSTVVLLLVTLSVVGFLFLSNKRHAMWLTVFATLGGALLTALSAGSFSTSTTLPTCSRGGPPGWRGPSRAGSSPYSYSAGAQSRGMSDRKWPLLAVGKGRRWIWH